MKKDAKEKHEVEWVELRPWIGKEDSLIHYTGYDGKEYVINATKKEE